MCFTLYTSISHSISARVSMSLSMIILGSVKLLCWFRTASGKLADSLRVRGSVRSVDLLRSEAPRTSK